MTVSEVLPIAGLSDEALIALIQPGDMLRIEGPGEDEVAVRFVDSYREIRSMIDNSSVSVARLVRQASLTITNVARTVPEVVLPTEPGYYESARYPLRGGYFALRLNPYGEWYRDGVRKTEEQMREHMPLTRLVPEAAPVKLRDRIVFVIDNGELDK